MANAKDQLWLERVGNGSYVGKSSRGLEVPIGHAPNEFTPGELLKLALAGCNATSADSRYAAALGDDASVTVGVEAEYDGDSNSFTNMVIEIVTDMSGLSAEEREKLEDRVRRAIEKRCTVGHTLNAGMPTQVVLTSESAS